MRTDIWFAYFTLLCGFVPNINTIILRGVTLVSEPFVNQIGINFNGYCVEVLNEIAVIAQFNYYLYTTPNATYGTVNQNKTNITGILGEVWSNEADFAISDIIVTESQKKFIDFTDPLMNYSISALILKSNVGDMKTFNDIADQMAISYGTTIDSLTWNLFKSSEDMRLRRMFALMSSSGVSVNDTEDGFDKVKNNRYAYIGDSAINEYIAANDCELTIISDDREYFRRQLAIALPKGSQYLTHFNEAIKQLVAIKRFQQIRDKYWKKNCLRDSSQRLVSLSIISFVCILVIQKFLL